MGFPGGSCNAGDLGSIHGFGRSPGEGNGHPLQNSGLENSMDYPWGCKELDTTERLSLSHESYWCLLCVPKDPPIILSKIDFFLL